MNLVQEFTLTAALKPPLPIGTVINPSDTTPTVYTESSCGCFVIVSAAVWDR